MVEPNFCLLGARGLEKDELEMTTHQEPVPKRKLALQASLIMTWMKRPQLYSEVNEANHGQMDEDRASLHEGEETRGRLGYNAGR